MSALDTRAYLARHQDWYLSPLPLTGATAEAMDAWITVGVTKGEADELTQIWRTNEGGAAGGGAAGSPTRRCVQGRLADYTSHDLARTSWLAPEPAARLLEDERRAAQEPGHVIDPAAVPVTGLCLERHYVLARRSDGAPVLWVQRRRMPLLSPRPVGCGSMSWRKQRQAEQSAVVSNIGRRTRGMRFENLIPPWKEGAMEAAKSVSPLRKFRSHLGAPRT